jgi:hypothetical protein
MDKPSEGPIVAIPPGTGGMPVPDIAIHPTGVEQTALSNAGNPASQGPKS